MNIIFDLDGTLIDSRLRLYRLFQQLAPSSNLSFEQYWVLKRNKVSNETILSTKLGQNNEFIASFVSKWMQLIESPSYLEMDGNLPGVLTNLAQLKNRASLHVCTARQLRQPALNQLASLDLLPFFDQVLVTEQKNSKDTLIKAHIRDLSSCDWIVGDTGKDIEVGKSLNIKTCAVLSGFLNRDSLLTYLPDVILDTAADFNLSLHKIVQTT